MSELDNKLEILINKDDLPFEVDPAIQQQLNYRMQLKASSTSVRQNSIIPFFGAFFTTKLMGIKISIITVALFAFIGYKQINPTNTIYINTDTASVFKSIDTLRNLATDDTLSLR